MAPSKFPVNKDAGTSGIANRKKSAAKRPFTNYDSEDSEDEVNERTGTSRNVHFTGLRLTEIVEKNQHISPKRLKLDSEKSCWWMNAKLEKIAKCKNDDLKNFVDEKKAPDGAVSRLKKP